jgi:uncharacterized protein (DUF58 family)
MRGDSFRFNPIVILVPAVILVLAVFGGHLFLWSLFFLSLLVFISSFAWVKLGIRGIDGGVEIANGDSQVGDSLLENVFVNNGSGLPKLMLRVWENTDMTEDDNRIVINLQPRDRYCRQSTIRCRRRGQFHIGSLTVEASDPFGLFRVQRKLGEERLLLVYPAVENHPFLPFLHDGESKSVHAYWLASEPCAVVSRVREYTPGDSLNYVHWRSTAHTGKLMVKIPAIDARREIWVVIDAANDLAKEPDPIFEENISIAASLVRGYLNHARSVGLLFESEDICLFPPGAGDKHYWDIMKALALMNKCGRMPVETLVRREQRNFKGKPLVLVITAAPTNGLADCLSHMEKRGVTTALISSSVSRFEGPFESHDPARVQTMGGIRSYVFSTSLPYEGFSQTPAGALWKDVAEK